MKIHNYELPLETDALPDICAENHCLQTAATGSNFCQTCGAQRKVSDLDQTDDIIIYAIQTESGPINIGSTTNVKRRLVDLQAGNHEQLELLSHCSARPNLAKDLIELLGGGKIRGKWFEEITMVVQAALCISEGTKALQDFISARVYRMDD